MPTYLDAAVVRIQPYLARTPDLRLRRGASWMITSATSERSVEAWIADAAINGLGTNPEAGHADGVIALMVPDDQAALAAKRLLLYMRSRIPAADLEASWGSAATYVEFRRAGPHHGDSLISMPPVADFPLARTCASCRVDVSAEAGKREGMCADCLERSAAGGRRRTSPGTPERADQKEEPDALGIERDILGAVNSLTGRELHPMRDINDLARLGEDDGNRNHVATVALDGNGMGGFFGALAASGDTGLKKRISPEVSIATRNALIGAAAHVCRDGDQWLAVVPHVMGGDDVVVSVTADRAWPFTREMLARFGGTLAAAAGRLSLPADLARRLPSISAGMVFTHSSFPYARAVQLAEEALRRAKRDTAGAEPAIGWLDVTVDGEQPPPWRTTLTLDALDTYRPDLAALSAIKPSGRQALARLLAADSEEAARAATLVWARRNGKTEVTGMLNRLTITRLRNLLALTRWWRP